MNILKTAQRFVDGVRNRKETKTYNFAFVKDKGVWYIDIPWDGNCGNLAMVAGAEAARMGINNTLKFEATEEETRLMFQKEKAARQMWYEKVRRKEQDLDNNFWNN